MTIIEVKRSGRQALGGAALCLVALTSGAADATAGASGVVELFTSQGCSSCGPADELLGELARDPDVVALSFAVDYWDYLGWRDTFAKPEFTKRQKMYAESRGDGSIYTPQAVINGREHIIGSDGKEIRQLLAEFSDSGRGLSVDVKARIEGDRVVVNVPAGELKPGTKAGVWIASFRKPETVEIGRGENQGQNITYYNIVDRWQVLGMWDGSEMTVELPLSDITSDRSAGCAVILQTKRDGMPGPILGAAKVDLAIN